MKQFENIKHFVEKTGVKKIPYINICSKLVKLSDEKQWIDTADIPSSYIGDLNMLGYLPDFDYSKFTNSESNVTLSDVSLEETKDNRRWAVNDDNGKSIQPISYFSEPNGYSNQDTANIGFLKVGEKTVIGISTEIERLEDEEELSEIEKSDMKDFGGRSFLSISEVLYNSEIAWHTASRKIKGKTIVTFEAKTPTTTKESNVEEGSVGVGGDYYIKDGKEFKKVDNAKSVKLDTDGDFFAVKNDNGGYTIHEAKSGVAIDANSFHKTIKDAINNANEKISKNATTLPLSRVIDGEIKRDGLSPRYLQNPKENTTVTDLLNEVNSGKINADDAAIKLDESGVEVSNEVYDQFREAEANFKKGENGLQVGDNVTVKGKNGNPDFKGNFRGITNEGKYVVVGENGYQNVYEKSDIAEQSLKETPKAEKGEDITYILIFKADNQLSGVNFVWGTGYLAEDEKIKDFFIEDSEMNSCIVQTDGLFDVEKTIEEINKIAFKRANDSNSEINIEGIRVSLTMKYGKPESGTANWSVPAWRVCDLKNCTDKNCGVFVVLDDDDTFSVLERRVNEDDEYEFDTVAEKITDEDKLLTEIFSAVVKNTKNAKEKKVEKLKVSSVENAPVLPIVESKQPTAQEVNEFLEKEVIVNEEEIELIKLVLENQIKKYDELISSAIGSEIKQSIMKERTKMNSIIDKIRNRSSLS